MTTAETPRYLRTPISLVRLVTAAGLAAALASRLNAQRQNHAASVLRDALASTPRWLANGIVGASQLGVLIPVALGLVALLLERRWRRLGRDVLAAAFTIGALALLLAWRRSGGLPILPPSGPRLAGGAGPIDHAVRDSGYGIGSLFPTGLDAGVIAALVMMDAENWRSGRRPWRWALLAALVLGRLGVGLAHPASVLAVMLSAAAAVQLTRAILGIPDSRPDATEVAAALNELGIGVDEVTPSVALGAFQGYGLRAGGRRMFAKVAHRDAWASYAPVRLLRSARFRDAAVQHPLRSLRADVEHEALCSLKARADGVPTPRLVEVVERPGGAFILLFDDEGYRPIGTDLSAEQRRRIVDGLWRVVASLRAGRIAHRRLSGEAVLADAEGRVIAAEFTHATIGARPDDLAADVAEVLVSSAAMIGPVPAVAVALDHVGADALATALPRLQPLALTAGTRATVKRTDTLDVLRSEVQRVTGAIDAPIAELERVRPRTLVMIAALAVAMWSLVPQLIGSSGVWSAIGDANWWWATAALAMSVATYAGAAASLAGSVSEPIPAGRNVALQYATSFASLVAPGGLLAITGRFLRQRGVTTEATAAAISINTLAGGIVHVSLTLLFLAIAGRSGLGDFALPSASTMLIVLAVVVALAALTAAVPRLRRLFSERVWPPIRRSLSGAGQVLSDPTKLTQLLGGSTVVTLGNIAALVAAVEAFGGGLSFAAIALVYLVGSAVSTVAPTPGGIGAVEATLIAGLTSAGSSAGTAAAAVLVYRTATFWLPLVPGWVSFGALQRSGDL